MYFYRNCIRLRLKQRKFLHKCRIRCLSQLPPASNSLSHSAFRSAFRSSFRSSSHSSSRSYPHWFRRSSQLILQRIPTRSAAHPVVRPAPPFPASTFCCPVLAFPLRADLQAVTNSLPLPISINVVNSTRRNSLLWKSQV